MFPRAGCGIQPMNNLKEIGAGEIKRIDQIVSNKHRKAYTRAAEVLIAPAECYFLRGEGEKSRKIVEEFRDEKYSRHYAFRREVDTVLDASILRSPLSGM